MVIHSIIIPHTLLFFNKFILRIKSKIKKDTHKRCPKIYYKLKYTTKETCVTYGHVIKKVLKAIYFIIKNDIAYDPLKVGGLK